MKRILLGKDILTQRSDGVQDMLLQNVVPWHTGHVKEKEFAETEAGRSLTSPFPFTPERGHQTSCET